MKTNKRSQRIRRHARIRAKIKGTAEVPRISVFRSNQYLSAQIIDDNSGKTLASVHDIVSKTQKKIAGSKIERAEAIAIVLADKAKSAGISKVLFDRGGYKYHGRVKAFAEALRKNGLNF